MLARTLITIISVGLFINCELKPYCINCEKGDGGFDIQQDLSKNIDILKDVVTDIERDSQRDSNIRDVCLPDAQEICNGKDDDCDGEVDEDFDLSSDPNNCGECGHRCELPHAFSECVNGECRIRECDVGYYDLDGEPENGCEYACLPRDTTTNEYCEGPDCCDFIDNDCDGEVDEDADLMNDPDNCGRCGNRCHFPHATAVCIDGECRLESCEENYYDIDGIVENGCEYYCEYQPSEPTPYCNGEDCCDGIDNDCDGEVDEDADLMNDPDNCGRCGFQCHFPNAIAVCHDGNCVLEECEIGYYDLDGDPRNGCEYRCSPNSETGGIEVCNLRDDDCDGEIDEDSDLPCSTECGTGVQRCVDGVLLECNAPHPRPEECNGLDDDCDGEIDEDFDLNSDPQNCGVCGNRCEFPNAIAGCENGQCVLLACLPGYYDIDPTVPGCEYQCQFRGNEECNGLDDDCDGEIDEDITPPEGYCGNFGVCRGVVPVCQGAQGWVCNYPPSYEADEQTCDGLDNDCDGLVDEGFDVGPQFPCIVGQGECQRRGYYVCNATGDGRVCNVSPGQPQPEICDGLDNDCDGVVDNNLTLNNMNLIHITGVDSDLDGDGVVGGDEINREFYIFQYEASRPDATSTSQGEISGYACSNPGVLPWTVVTWSEARDACCGLNSDGQCHYRTIRTSQGSMRVPQGWNLCLAGDWEVACQQAGFSSVPPEDNGLPYLYPYGDNYQANYCNGSDYDPSCPDGGDDCLLPTGSLSTCVGSNFAVYDMSGNAYEWTYTGYVINGVNYYEYRGGSYKNPAPGLTCQFDFNVGRDSPDFVLENLGFRCCYYP